MDEVAAAVVITPTKLYSLPNNNQRLSSCGCLKARNLRTNPLNWINLLQTRLYLKRHILTRSCQGSSPCKAKTSRRKGNHRSNTQTREVATEGVVVALPGDTSLDIKKRCHWYLMALSLSLLVNSQLLLTLFTPEEEVEAVEVEEMSDHRPLSNSRSLLPSFSETESQKRRGLKESDSHQLDQELLPSSQAEISK